MVFNCVFSSTCRYLMLTSWMFFGLLMTHFVSMLILHESRCFGLL